MQMELSEMDQMELIGISLDLTLLVRYDAKIRETLSTQLRVVDTQDDTDSTNYARKETAHTARCSGTETSHTAMRAPVHDAETEEDLMADESD